MTCAQYSKSSKAIWWLCTKHIFIPVVCERGEQIIILTQIFESAEPVPKSVWKIYSQNSQWQLFKFLTQTTSHYFKWLGIYSHRNYVNDSIMVLLHNFWSLKAPALIHCNNMQTNDLWIIGIIEKCLFLCFTEERNAYRPVTMWGRVPTST